MPIAQCSLAAGIAWFVAHQLIGHVVPFFAPTAAVTTIGISLGGRLRRAVELVVGATVGVGVGDLFIRMVGTGSWQIALVVAVAMATAVLLNGGAAVAMQAASSAVLIAVLLPQGSTAPGDRMVDALVGGLVGIAVVATIPGNPVQRTRRQAGEILSIAASALRDCADGLLEQDAGPIRAALERARGTQSKLDALRGFVAGEQELARVSPLYWNSRRRLQRLAVIADPLDNAIRNIRVLLRRALTLVRDDEILNPGIIAEIRTLADAVDVLRTMVLADPGQDPTPETAQAALRKVAQGATPDMVADAGLSAHVVFAQLRSATVDLLQVAGTDRLSAMSWLPPTVNHPYVKPA